MFIGSRLQILRKKRKITQKVLAEKAGISRSYLSDVEHNRYNPSLDTVEALAMALKLDLKSFFDDNLLEKNFYLKPLSELENDIKVEEMNTFEMESYLENVENALKEGSYKKVDVGEYFDEILRSLGDYEKFVMIDNMVLDYEIRDILKNNIEISLKMVKLICKSSRN